MAARLGLGMAAAVALVAAAGCTKGAPLDAPRTPTTKTAGSGAPVAPAPPAPPRWHVVANPPVDPANRLDQVVAVDASHAWAVGSERYSPVQPDTTGVPLILRWDGAAWHRDPLPTGGWIGGMTLVAADSVTDVWAVGAHSGASPESTVTRVLHDDGTGWREVPFPAGNSPSITLITGLAVVAGHAWLVGNKRSEVVIQEWDGQAWHAHRPPAECQQQGTSSGGMPAFCTFTGITAFAADDIWVAGNGAWKGFLGPLLFHWNGTAWRPVQVGFNNQQYFLTAVAGHAGDIWAVGNLFNSSEPLVLHGDGTAWTVVHEAPQAKLVAAALDAGGGLWVSGNTPAPATTLSTYSGGGWVDTPAPVPAGGRGVILLSVTAVPGTAVLLAVGYVYLPTNPLTVGAVIEEYSPTTGLSGSSGPPTASRPAPGTRRAPPADGRSSRYRPG